MPCGWKTYLHLIKQCMPMEMSSLLASCIILYSCILDPDALAKDIFLQEYCLREAVLIAVFAIIDWTMAITKDRQGNILILHCTASVLPSKANKKKYKKIKIYFYYLFILSSTSKKRLKGLLKKLASMSCRHFQSSHEAFNN